MSRQTYKGKYYPKNRSKYKGDPTNVIYRSGWERVVMSYLDKNENVLEWSSEEIIIPYISPWDGKPHRYFPDFWVKVKDVNGNTKQIILEIKPEKETQRPKQPKRITKKFLNEVATWGVNHAKWTAAREYCRDRDMAFEFVTEKDLNLVGKKW